MYDLIIIGAGPAGISAGIYAIRQRLKVLIISKDIGGQVAKKAVEIENYPGFEKISGPSLVDLYQKQIAFNKLKLIHDEVVNIEKISDTFFIYTKFGEKYESISVIISSGAESRKIGIPGEEEFAGKGVSYCSLCDGALFKDKIVAVIGGGNNGFESAIFLSNYVEKIYILEYSEKVKADRENQELVLAQKNIEIIASAKILKIEGKNFTEAIFYQDLKTGKEKKLEVNGVFVEIGYLPSTAFAKNLVEFNEKGEIISDANILSTRTPGLFSAGDCNVGKYKQIVISSGQGALAALSAYEYIKKAHARKNYYK